MQTTIRFGNSSSRPGVKILTDKSTFPTYSTIGSGTWSSSGVNCTATNVKPEDIKAGDFIYSSANDQVRRIVSNPTPNSNFVIDEAFDADVAGESFKIIPQEKLVRGIGLKNIGTTDAEVDGTVYSPTSPAVSFYNPNGIAAIAYDASAGTNSLLLTIEW